MKQIRKPKPRPRPANEPDRRTPSGRPMVLRHPFIAATTFAWLMVLSALIGLTLGHGYGEAPTMPLRVVL